MSLITPERARELLALLPAQETLSVENVKIKADGRHIATVYDKHYREPLAASADALRTVLRLSALLDEIQVLTPAFPHMLTDAALRGRMKQIHALLEQHGIQAEAGA